MSEVPGGSGRSALSPRPRLALIRGAPPVELVQAASPLEARPSFAHERIAQPCSRDPAVIAQASRPADVGHVEASCGARGARQVLPQARGGAAQQRARRAAKAEPLLAG